MADSDDDEPPPDAFGVELAARQRRLQERRSVVNADNNIDLILAGRSSNKSIVIPQGTRMRNQRIQRLMIESERDYLHLLGEVNGDTYDIQGRPELELITVGLNSNNSSSYSHIDKEKLNKELEEDEDDQEGNAEEKARKVIMENISSEATKKVGEPTAPEMVNVATSIVPPAEIRIDSKSNDSNEAKPALLDEKDEANDPMEDMKILYNGAKSCFVLSPKIEDKLLAELMDQKQQKAVASATGSAITREIIVKSCECRFGDHMFNTINPVIHRVWRRFIRVCLLPQLNDDDRVFLMEDRLNDVIAYLDDCLPESLANSDSDSIVSFEEERKKRGKKKKRAGKKRPTAGEESDSSDVVAAGSGSTRMDAKGSPKTGQSSKKVPPSLKMAKMGASSRKLGQSGKKGTSKNLLKGL